MADAIHPPPLRVLVVEDEPLIAMVIEDVLLDMGADMLGPIGHLDDATFAARSQVFDIAVLDVNIFGGPVYPVADLLLQRNIPFILATGYAAATLPKHLATVPRLAKPYTASELEVELKRLQLQIR